MSLAAVALAVLLLYMVAGTILAWVSRKRMGGWSEREFYVAGGRLGSLSSALTYAATTYSSFMIVGLVGFTYAWGVGAFGFELAYYIATVTLLLLFSRRVWRMARERGWVSPGEALADLYGGRIVAVAASLLFLVALIPYAAAQLKGIGEAFSAVAGGGLRYYEAGVILGIAVMVIWSMIAGMWSVALTDVLQGLWMLGAATGLLAWLYLTLRGSGLGLGDASEILDNAGLTGLEPYWPLARFLAFTVPWVFFAVTNPQVVQRLYVPRSEASLSGMVRWFAVFGLYYTVIVTLVGLLARAGAEAGVLDYVAPEDRDMVTPTLLLQAPPILAAVVFTSIVAAAVSTADSILLALASSVSRDLLPRHPRRRAVAAGAVALVAGAMAAVALARTGYIVALSVLSSLLLLPLAPVTIAAWLGARPGQTAALASLAAGTLVNAAVAVYYGNPLAAFAAAPLGVPVSVWVLAASTAPLAIALAVRARR